MIKTNKQNKKQTKHSNNTHQQKTFLKQIKNNFKQNTKKTHTHTHTYKQKHTQRQHNKQQHNNKTRTHLKRIVKTMLNINSQSNRTFV